MKKPLARARDSFSALVIIVASATAKRQCTRRRKEARFCRTGRSRPYCRPSPFPLSPIHSASQWLPCKSSSGVSEVLSENPPHSHKASVCPREAENLLEKLRNRGLLFPCIRLLVLPLGRPSIFQARVSNRA